MNRRTKMALLSASLLIVTAGAIAANIPAIAAAYPDINGTVIELLTTMPSLFTILTVLVSHRVAGKISAYRTVQLGIFVVLTAGLIPVFFPSFWLLFFSRILFGIGIGLFNPLLYTIASKLYKGRELATVIGLQSAFEGIGGMLATFLVGQLLVIQWRASFLVYALALPILLLFSLFVPRIDYHVAEKPAPAGAPKKAAVSIGGYIFLLVVSVTVYMSVSVKVTALLLLKGIGDATDGSNLLALIGLGAMSSGILFGRVVGFLKKRTLPAAFAGMSLAMFLIAFSENLFLASAAAVLAGFSFRTFVPYVFNEINQKSATAQRDTSILLIAFNIGTAFTPVSIALVQRVLPWLDQAGLFIGEGLLMLLLALGTAGVMNRRPGTEQSLEG